MKKYILNDRTIKTLVNRAIETNYRIEIAPVLKIRGGDYVSPVNDIVFKAVFLNELFKPYLAAFLSHFIDIDREEILTKAIIHESHIPKHNIYNKTEIADLLIEIDDTIISIELNNTNTLARNYEYACRLASANVKIGNRNYKYRNLFQLNINNFSFKGNDRTFETYEIKNDYDELYNRMQFGQIYLPNIKKKYYHSGEEIESLEKWERDILTLFECDREILKKLTERNRFMKKYVEKVESVLIGDDLKEAYDHRAEEMKITKYIALKEGRKEGRKEGLKEGREKGAQETKIKIAKSLSQEGMTLEKIQKITGLNNIELSNILV